MLHKDAACVHCLIIDDNQDNSYILWRMLRGIGVSSSTVYNGFEGIAYCKQLMPDVIFLDWMMPGMDGIEFIGKLREMIAGKDSIVDMPAIIMCSGKFSDGEVSEAHKAGAKGYLPKPFTEIMLQNELSKLSYLSDAFKEISGSTGSKNHYH